MTVITDSVSFLVCSPILNKEKEDLKDFQSGFSKKWDQATFTDRQAKLDKMSKPNPKPLNKIGDKLFVTGAIHIVATLILIGLGIAFTIAFTITAPINAVIFAAAAATLAVAIACIILGLKKERQANQILQKKGPYFSLEQEIQNKKTEISKLERAVSKNNVSSGRNLLHIASLIGDFEAVSEMLTLKDSKYFVDVTDSKYRKPLYYAVDGGHYDIAQLLIAHGASVEGLKMSNDSPLNLACRKDRLDLVQLLVENGAKYDEDVNLSIFRGNTPLLRTCALGRKKIVQYFVNKELEKEIKPEDNGTQEIVPVGQRSPSLQKLIDHTNFSGQNLLHIACENGHLKLAQFLISIGFSVQSKTDGGYTPLHYAAKNNHPDVIDQLCDSVDVDQQRGLSEQTALFIACMNGNLEAIRRLLFFHGANFMLKGYWDAIHALAGNRSKELAITPFQLLFNEKIRNKFATIFDGKLPQSQVDQIAKDLGFHPFEKAFLSGDPEATFNVFKHQDYQIFEYGTLKASIGVRFHALFEREKGKKSAVILDFLNKMDDFAKLAKDTNYAEFQEQCDRSWNAFFGEMHVPGLGTSEEEPSAESFFFERSTAASIPLSSDDFKEAVKELIPDHDQNTVSAYAIFGVESDADQEAVNTAYRKLSLKWDPDRNREGKAVFQLISAAKELLDEKFEKQKKQ